MQSLGKATIIPVLSSEIGHYQKIAVPFIQDALEHTDGESSLRDILHGIATQQRQLWLLKAGDEFIGGVVSQMYTTENGIKIGEVTLASGRDYASWSHFIDVVGAWFKSQGCTICQVIGRPGWERRLEGFQRKYVVLRKGL